VIIAKSIDPFVRPAEYMDKEDKENELKQGDSHFFSQYI
jgi:hypothetical protein